MLRDAEMSLQTHLSRANNTLFGESPLFGVVMRGAMDTKSANQHGDHEEPKKVTNQ